MFLTELTENFFSKEKIRKVMDGGFPKDDDIDRNKLDK